MTSSSASRALATAAAAMVNDGDTAGTLSNLLVDCASATTAAAIGILVRNDQGQLELLSASSHLAAELELYGLQYNIGPCLDAISTGRPVIESDDSVIAERWNEVGRAFVAAGFHAVHAVPLRWQGRLIGAFNAFHHTPATLTPAAEELTQTFADIASVVIVQSGRETKQQLGDRVREALAQRIAIEQAKGVLAHRHDLDMASAYQHLLREAVSTGTSLSSAAAAVIRQAFERS